MNSISLKRRSTLHALGVLFSGMAGIKALAAENVPVRIVKIETERFQFTPNRIELKLGEPVVLEFTALDFPMGFNVPSFGLRTNILPDQPAQLKLTPQKKGLHPFHCDVACGSGHATMTGVIVVT